MLRETNASWQCGWHDLSLSRPRIMGILNATPDSFSDGGAHFDTKEAIAYGLEMLDAGADIIDVGGESTRPGHTPVTPEEEAARVVPVVRGIMQEAPQAIVSVDTRHADVARMCVRLGASVINDVSGFQDPAMQQVAIESACGLVIVHGHQMTGATSRRQVQLDSIKPARQVTSARRFTLPEEAPIMREIMGFLGDQARMLMRARIPKERLCIDPGAGFDKTAPEDVVIQRNMRKLVSLGYPVMCAVSRKRFVGAVTGEQEPLERDDATMGMVLAAIEAGARIVRVHDVAGAADAINAYWAASRKDSRQGFVSLGSNVGDRVGYLAQAAHLIDQIPLTCVVAVSRAYETEPAYGLAEPAANAVAEIRTELHPAVLVDALLEVERQLGRVREQTSDGLEAMEAPAGEITVTGTGKVISTPAPAATAAKGPRTIDCDLCWVEGESHAGPHLTLPHPLLGERDFVLVPMEDLMHDPVRFLVHAGVPVYEPERRVGHVIADLGEIAWERA